MQKITWMLFLVSITTISQNLVLTGIVDGPLEGGTPKVIELYAQEDIPDLSKYGLGSITDGSGISKMEYQLSGSVAKGQFIYISKEQPGFENFFGFAPDYISNVANINGDDAIELFYQPTEDGDLMVYDTFGDINTDGTGELWEYTNGWARRLDPELQKPSNFDHNQWVFSGKNALNEAIDNATATIPFPIENTERTLHVSSNLIQNKDIVLYPNPTTDGRVFLRSTNQKQLNVAIYNTIGNYLGNQKVNRDIINMTHLKTGIYFLKFDYNDQTIIKRIVKD